MAFLARLFQHDTTRTVSPDTPQIEFPEVVRTQKGSGGKQGIQLGGGGGECALNSDWGDPECPRIFLMFGEVDFFFF